MSHEHTAPFPKPRNEPRCSLPSACDIVWTSGMACPCGGANIPSSSVPLGFADGLDGPLIYDDVITRKRTSALPSAAVCSVLCWTGVDGVDGVPRSRRSGGGRAPSLQCLRSFPLVDWRAFIKQHHKHTQTHTHTLRAHSPAECDPLLQTAQPTEHE